MQIGLYVDGRELTHPEGSCEFAIGGTPVTLDDVLQYDAFGQIMWASEETREWAYGLKAWENAALVNDLANQRQLELRYGHSNPMMVCPHCQTKGSIRTKAVKQKKGVSGGKATAAVLTGGVSLLATGLSRKEQATQAFCGNCGNTWFY